MKCQSVLNRLGLTLGVCIGGLMFTGCGADDADSMESQGEGVPAEVRPPTDDSGRMLAYPRGIHYELARMAAVSLGLPSGRALRMADAANDPDDLDPQETTGQFNILWSHAYLLNGTLGYVWGDADDNFNDNINGYSGEVESPEGLYGKSAKYYYQRGDQWNGDYYVGYAAHYIEDTCLVTHTSANMDTDFYSKTAHDALELWLYNNMWNGHDLLGKVSWDTTKWGANTKASIVDAAKLSSYSAGASGKGLWNEYKACKNSMGHWPTGENECSAAAAYAKYQVNYAYQYTKGAIKYALNTYSQWNMPIQARTPASCGYLRAGEGLVPGRNVYSCDGRFRLTMGSDNVLYLYQGSNILWRSSWFSLLETGAGQTIMQGDGNLVTYDRMGFPRWHTATSGYSGNFFAIQNDGNLVMYTSAWKPLWDSGTWGH